MKILTGRAVRARTFLSRRTPLVAATFALFTVAGQFAGQLAAQPPAGASTRQPPASALPKTIPVPTTHEGLFAERDGRAVRALGYLRCLNGTLGAIRAGMLGQVPRSWLMVCVEQGSDWRAVFTEPVEQGSGDLKVRLQFSMSAGRVVDTGLDSARALGATRALMRALQAPTPGAGKYQYMPVILPQERFIEIWFLPVPSSPARVVVGGDSLIQMNQEGTRELGHTSTAPSIRTFALPSTSRSLVLESREGRLPLLSELMVAHVALASSDEVRVLTAEYESRFRRGESAPTHVRR